MTSRTTPTAVNAGMMTAAESDLNVVLSLGPVVRSEGLEPGISLGGGENSCALAKILLN